MTHYLSRSMRLLLVLSVAFPLGAQVSLSTIVSMAERNSAAVRLAQADLQKAEAQLAETHDVYIPVVDFNAGVGVAEGFMGGQIPSVWTASAQSEIFSLPHVQYERAARSGVESAKLNLLNAREQVALNTSTLYIQLDTLRRQQDAAMTEEQHASRLVEIEEERSEVGVDSLREYLDARLTAANIKLKRMHLESAISAAQIQLSHLTGMPSSSITTVSRSIPAIPRLTADTTQGRHYAMESIQQQAISKSRIAQGDKMNIYSPQIGFQFEYLRHTTLFNNYDSYYNGTIPANSYSVGISFTLPLLDLSHRGKARESSADALRSRIEAEQAMHQNDLNIACINNNLKELEVLAEISDLKQQIASQDLKAVQTEINAGNGSSSTPQASPGKEELSQIAERDKYIEALDATLDLSKARLNLIEALGHMEDWLGLVDAAKPASDSK